MYWSASGFVDKNFVDDSACYNSLYDSPSAENARRLGSLFHQDVLLSA